MAETPRYYAAARTSFAEDLKGGCEDLAASFRNARIWIALGLNDIAARYRGSMLGPFWITLATVIFVLGIGFLYADLMKIPTDRYLPWITIGLVLWGLISQTILDGAEAFVAASQVLRQTAIPLSLFIWRVAWRNVLTFAHQLPVVFAVALWFHFLVHMNLLAAVVGLVLVEINTSWVALLAAIACARFRDLQQVLASIIQLMFFMSPVMWIPSEIKGFGGALVVVNPVVHMMNVVRGPLLGQGFSRFSALYLAASAVVGWTVALLLFSKVRRRIVHYI